MRKIFDCLWIAALLLALAAPASPQASTIANLATVSAPASTDWFVLQQVGSARAVKQSRGNLLAGIFGTATTCAQHAVVAAPSASSGSLSCRVLVASDIPALSYVASLSGPTGVTWSGTAPATGSWSSQTANLFLASPSGSSGAPTFRAFTAADLANSLVTYAKIQNVSATNRLLGRSTAGAGVIEEITVGSGLTLSAGTLSSTTGGSVTSVTGPASLLSWATNTTTPTASLATQSALTLFGNNTGSTAAPTFFAISTLDHNGLANLTTGDVHTQYALLAGRTSSQTINGSTSGGGSLNLHGSTNAASSGVFVTNGDNFTLLSANSAQWVHGQLSQAISFSGGSTVATSNGSLPANSVIRAVVTRVTGAFSGACSSFGVGDGTTATRFAASVPLTLNSTQVGLAHVDQTGAAGPKQTATANVTLTCSASASAGTVRVTVFYDQFVAPTS